MHPELIQAGLEPGVRAVIAGERARVPEVDPSVEPHEREAILRTDRARLPASGIYFGWGWPKAWSDVHRDELQRRMDAEIPARPDGQPWYGATIRGVVRRAGLTPCVRPSRWPTQR